MPTRDGWRGSALGAALLFVSAACASTGGGERAPLRPDDVPVFATETGERVDLDALLGSIAAADVVLLGELHGHPAGLAFDAALFERSLERNPDAALCLEFLTRETQFLVDAYLDGLLDWEGFRDACDDIPGSQPVPHRPLIDAARAAHVPVVAANAPRLYTGAAREHGYERLTALTSEQLRLFDVPAEAPSGAYREAFFEQMSGHQESGDVDASEAAAAAAAEAEAQRVEGFFRAQGLWDMTMASSAARSLEAGRRPVFLVVGSFHCNSDGGTVQMLRHLRPEAKTLVVTFVDEDSDILLEEHAALADFVAYVGPSNAER